MEQKIKRVKNHDHSHSHSHNTEGNIGLAFFLNLSFTIIELIGGLITNSVAIVSDAVHDFGDSISLAMAWYFQKLSKKGRGDKYSYGYRRFSLLGAILNSAILIIGSIYIISEALQRLSDPQATNAIGMFILAIVGILVNGFAVLKTYKTNSINERVVSLHLLEDVLGWVAVLVGSIIMYFTGLTIIDPILSLGIACFILYNACKSAKQVLHILLQGSPDSSKQKHITEMIEEIKEVKQVHDLHIWSLDEDYKVLTIHIVLNRSQTMGEISQIKQNIRALLSEEGIKHSTIEFETSTEGCDFKNCSE